MDRRSKNIDGDWQVTAQLGSISLAYIEVSEVLLAEVEHMLPEGLESETKGAVARSV